MNINGESLTTQGVLRLALHGTTQPRGTRPRLDAAHHPKFDPSCFDEPQCEELCPLEDQGPNPEFLDFMKTILNDITT